MLYQMTGLELRKWRESHFLLIEEAARERAIPLHKWQYWESRPEKLIPWRVAKIIKAADELREAMKRHEAAREEMNRRLYQKSE